jgi:YjbE family integral membrane protein
VDAIATHAFWIGLLKIIGVNIVLSGDNAVVIALAARSLPPKQQKQAVLWGSAAAIVMRIVLTVFAVKLLTLPWLKIVGSLLLLWIGIQLLVPEDDGEDGVDASDNMLAAIKTILIADLVMSLDNVIAVAAAAQGDLLLLIIGLAISIPLVIFGSTLLLRVMERFPFIVTVGGALIGFVAGEMMVSDPALHDWMAANFRLVEGHPVVGPVHLSLITGVIGAAVVILAGKVLARRSGTGEGAEERPSEEIVLPPPAGDGTRNR